MANVAELLTRPGVHNLTELIGGHHALSLVVLHAAERCKPEPTHWGTPAIALLDGGPVQVGFEDGATLIINSERDLARYSGTLSELVNLDVRTAAVLLAAARQRGK